MNKIIHLKVLYFAHFQVHTFILGVYNEVFTCFNVPKSPSLLRLVGSGRPEQAPSTMFPRQLSGAVTVKL